MALIAPQAERLASSSMERQLGIAALGARQPAQRLAPQDVQRLAGFASTFAP
jgi:hypothetical protein